MKRIVFAILGLYLTIAPALALELDLSVDEEIRINYNPSKLEQQNLPPLPKTAPSFLSPPSRRSAAVRRARRHRLPQTPRPPAHGLRHNYGYRKVKRDN